MSNLKEDIKQKYGLLVDYRQLAEILRRSEGGLRVSLNRENGLMGPTAKLIKIKIGRRVLFSADNVAEVLNSQFASEEESK